MLRTSPAGAFPQLHWRRWAPSRALRTSPAALAAPVVLSDAPHISRPALSPGCTGCAGGCICADPRLHSLRWRSSFVCSALLAAPVVLSDVPRISIRRTSPVALAAPVGRLRSARIPGSIASFTVWVLSHPRLHASAPSCALSGCSYLLLSPSAISRAIAGWSHPRFSFLCAFFRVLGAFVPSLRFQARSQGIRSPGFSCLCALAISGSAYPRPSCPCVFLRLFGGSYPRLLHSSFMPLRFHALPFAVSCPRRSCLCAFMRT